MRSMVIRQEQQKVDLEYQLQDSNSMAAQKRILIKELEELEEIKEKQYKKV